MRRLLPLVVVTALASTACQTSPPTATKLPPPSLAPERGRPLEERVARVESGLLPPVLVQGERPWTLEERMRHYRVAGMSLAVIEGFEVAWVRAYGVADRGTGMPVTTETLFQASSMSKPMASAIALRLAEEGRLSLDADINGILRSWKLPPPESEPEGGAVPVTLTSLLSHSAGLSVPGSPGFEPGEPLPTLLQMLDGLPPANTRPVRLEHEPGELNYSGGGYMILQQLLEDVTGRPFADLAGEMVLRPLGMTRSTFAQPLPAPAPAMAARAASGHDEDGEVLPERWRVHVDLATAGLWSTAGDYARFVTALQRALAGRPSILKPETARRMVTPVTSRSGLGLDLVRRGEVTYFGHGGGNWGYSSVFFAHPQKGYGVVILTNSDAGDAFAGEVVRAVAKEYAWEGILPRPLWRAALPEEALDRMAGRYRLDADEALTLQRRGDRLLASPVLGEPFELLPVDGGTLVRVDQRQEYRVETDLTGNGTGLSTREAGEEWGPFGPRLAPGERVPSEMLEAGNVEAAIAALDGLRQKTPDDPAVERERLEERARALLERGKPDAAVALLRLAIDLYPGFAGTWDALAEAHLALGDEAAAREASREALRALETDFSPTASWRVVYRRNAERRLKEPPPGTGSTP